MGLLTLDHVSNVNIVPLDWTLVTAQDDATLSLLHEARPTWVLAADVVYDPTLVGDLANTLQVALKEHDGQCPRALVASTIRNPNTYQFFLDALVARGLTWRVIPDDTTHWQAWPSVRLFPSTHDPELDGRVELLEIQRAY